MEECRGHHGQSMSDVRIRAQLQTVISDVES